MAKAKRGGSGESKSQVFKTIYRENPHLLDVRGYDEALEKYKQAVPGADMNKALRGVAANIKSKLNEARGVRPRRKRRGKKGGRPAAAIGVMAATPKVPAGALRTLEDHIDDCMHLAKRLDPTRLADVVRHLRHARNMVILRADE
jgi:hypothetical protein